MNTTKDKDKVLQEDQMPPEEPEGKDEPLDLEGYDTMTQTFGAGMNRRVVLVGRPISLNQLVAMSK